MEGWELRLRREPIGIMTTTKRYPSLERRGREVDGRWCYGFVIRHSHSIRALLVTPLLFSFAAGYCWIWVSGLCLSTPTNYTDDADDGWMGWVNHLCCWLVSRPHHHRQLAIIAVSSFTRKAEAAGLLACLQENLASCLRCIHITFHASPLSHTQTHTHALPLPDTYSHSHAHSLSLLLSHSCQQ
jgi:hypothetical protein